MQYEQEVLSRLHQELIDILEETIRVCDVLNIPYFIIGGTAIGALFNGGIVPWDDDVDIGMLREDYSRFIREAPAVINPQYEIQCFEYEPRTPCYWVKIMKRGTLFVMDEWVNLPISKGIFIDVFPYDKVPNALWKEKLHRCLISFVQALFVNKQNGKQWLEVRLTSRKVPRFIALPLEYIYSALPSLFSRKSLFSILTKLQTWYNDRKCKFVNIVLMPKDHIPVEDVYNTVEVKFDRLTVKAPNHIDDYLMHHYPWLTPIPPKDKQVNHKPLIIDFGDEIDSGY